MKTPQGDRCLATGKRIETPKIGDYISFLINKLKLVAKNNGTAISQIIFCAYQINLGNFVIKLQMKILIVP